MKSFELLRPESLAQAQQSVTADPKGRVIRAGGIDLLDRMKEGLEAPTHLVELRRISDLPGLGAFELGAPSRLGAMTTLAEIADAQELPAALRGAANEAATPGIRNTATLGGNLLQRPRCWYFRNAELVCLKKGGDTCLALQGENRYHAILGGGPSFIVHPSSMATPLLALDATVLVSSPGKAPEEWTSRPLSELFVHPRTDATREHSLAAGEVLVQVEVPRGNGYVSAYRAAREKQSHDWPLAEAAVSLRLDEAGGKIHDIRIALGHVAPVPWLAESAMKVAEGKAPSAALFAKVAAAAVEAAKPLGDNVYKVPLVRGLVRYALHDACRVPLPA